MSCFRLILAAMCCVAIRATAMFVVPSEQQSPGGEWRCAPSICVPAKWRMRCDLRSAQQAVAAAGSPSGCRRSTRRWTPSPALFRRFSSRPRSGGEGGCSKKRRRRQFRTVDNGSRLHHVRRRADGGRHRVHRRQRGGGDGRSRWRARALNVRSRCLQAGRKQETLAIASRGAVAVGNRGAGAGAGAAATPRSD